jgi:hypothetical protein
MENIHEPNPAFLRVLTRLGEGNILLSSDRELFSQFLPNKLGDITKCLHFEELDDKDLAITFIGLVRIETEMEFDCAENSPSILIYQIIEQRGLDRHMMFANWAFQYAQNAYIPFGYVPPVSGTSVYQIKNIPKPDIIHHITDTSEYLDVERRFVFSGLICPYCANKTQLVDSAEIYHGNSYGMMYRCQDCDAYVGCYSGTHHALGILADKSLREAKNKAHFYFDQLWKPKVTKRHAWYQWLSKTLSIPIEFTHIGMSNVEQCNKIIEVSMARLKEEGKI